MSISKQWVADTKNQAAVLSLYRGQDFLPIDKIAEQLKTSYHNVSYVLLHCMPEAERKALSKVRYSAAKTGRKNPMSGKTGKAHHNWKGECPDGYGYLTCLHQGKREFVHRVVMMKALGLKRLLATWEVHHIDNDPLNNDLDNLCLTTRAGHRRVHYLQAKDSLLLRSRKSSIADALRYMTSPSKTTPAT